MNIFPTGECFDDAFDFLMSHKTNRFMLCHGLVSPKKAGRDVPYAHAWILDKGRRCNYEWGLKEGIEKIQVGYKNMSFYEELRPSIITYYTWRQAIINTFLHDSAGPWDRSYFGYLKGGPWAPTRQRVLRLSTLVRDLEEEGISLTSLP